MESNAFGNSHLPSQALVVLSEAASGLHEALRGQRPFPSRVSNLTLSWNKNFKVKMLGFEATTRSTKIFMNE